MTDSTPQSEPESEELAYKVSDLATCDVFTVEGELLGHLVDVLPSNAHDIYVVQKERREYLIPALKKIVRLIDLEKHRIEVSLPPGLREIYEM